MTEPTKSWMDMGCSFFGCGIIILVVIMCLYEVVTEPKKPVDPRTRPYVVQYPDDCKRVIDYSISKRYHDGASPSVTYMSTDGRVKTAVYTDKGKFYKIFIWQK